MAAGLRHEDAYPPHEQPDVPEFNPLSLVPLPRTPEEIFDEAEEEQIEQAFYTFSLTSDQDRNPINPYTAEASESPQLAHTVHDFLFQTAQLHAAEAQARGEKLWVMPPAPIRSRINDYYRQFGTHRRRKSDPKLRTAEEKFLEENLRPVTAVAYVGGGLDERGEPIPRKMVARATAFPEMAVGLSLHAALRENGHQTAADSVEVVLAAYGARFLTIAGQGGRVVVQKTRARAHNIREINQADIPPEARAEDYRES